MKPLIAIFFVIIYSVFVTPFTWSDEPETTALSGSTQWAPAGESGMADQPDFSTRSPSVLPVHIYPSAAKLSKSSRAFCLTEALYRYRFQQPTTPLKISLPLTGITPLHPTIRKDVLRI